MVREGELVKIGKSYHIYVFNKVTDSESVSSVASFSELRFGLDYHLGSCLAGLYSVQYTIVCVDYSSNAHEISHYCIPYSETIDKYQYI